MFALCARGYQLIAAPKTKKAHTGSYRQINKTNMSP